MMEVTSLKRASAEPNEAEPSAKKSKPTRGEVNWMSTFPLDNVRAIEGFLGEPITAFEDGTDMRILAKRIKRDFDKDKWLAPGVRDDVCRHLAYDIPKSRLCDIAAANGRLGELQMARANGCDRSPFTCAEAAEGGHLEVLKWARANGCYWAALTCASAAMGGQLDILKWLRANGCPWDAWSCTHAAKRGDLPMLKWLRANGCPWNIDVCSQAAAGGHLDVLQWARANGCPQS
jgi:hypothetical protein